MDVVIESNILPPITVSGSGGGDSLGLMQLVAPTVRVGGLTVAPYGEAAPGVGAVVALVFVGLAVYGAITLMRGR